ncbi:MAG TPA: NADH-quinone oxidoreductase subunit K [Anaeromyxobacteraceae bacterium]|jgi:hydrogenase-4 component E
MARLADMVFILVVVLDLVLLASSRLKVAIRTVAGQGALLALLPVLLVTDEHDWGHVAALAAGALLVKGFAIPRMMLWAMREAAVSRELEPIVGFVPSMLLGAVGVLLSFVFAGALPLPGPEKHALLVPTALSTVWTGLLLVVSRRKAVAQVLGFLVLENGVFVFGVLISDFMPVMVEAGVLLDLFAAVFVMGIVIFHINREFSSLDTEKLSALKD